MRTPIDIDADLWDEIGFLFDDVSLYRRVIGKFIYLTATRLDIAYAID